MRRLTFFILFAFAIHMAIAQQKSCDAHVKNVEMMQKNELFKQSHKEIEEYTRNYIKYYTPRKAGSKDKSTIRRINVVVHIVYEDSTENFTDEEVIEAIDSLNKDFRALNHNGTLNPSQNFKNLWADTEIDFQLATIDPDGNTTTGITRTETTVSNFSSTNDDMKFTAQGGIDGWDPNKYLNIWVCTYGSALDLGYAYYPAVLNSDPELDGCVINTPAFAISGNRLGRTLTHEIGHYFNLDHIFGDGSECSDDNVDDTPIPQFANYGCPTYPYNANNSCTNGTDADGEMFMNFMDYTDDECMSMFTFGQAARMNAVLDGTRKNLFTSVTAVEEDIVAKELTVSPNPVMDVAIITMPLNQHVELKLCNSIGENVNVEYNQHGAQLLLDTRLLSTGMYTLIIVSKDSVYSTKLVKQ